MADQAEKLRDLARQVRQNTTQRTAASRPGVRTRSARVFAVSSGKGGVGKTNVSINLALSLCKRGKKVLLLDADLGLANADVLLGMSTRHNLSHFFQGIKTLEEIIAVGPLGLMVIASGSGLSQMADLRNQDRDRVLAHLGAIEKMADVIVVDTGAGIGKNVTSFAMAADECIVVTTPEPTARLDAYGLIKVLAQEGYRGITRLVVNMSEGPSEGEEMGGLMETLAKRFLNAHLQYLGHIPRDSSVRRAVNRQSPFTLAYPDCSASRAVDQIAAKLLDLPAGDANEGMKGFLGRLSDLLKAGKSGS